MTRKIIAALALAGVLSALGAVSGCNTIAGAGTDIERGGQEIREGAKDVQKKM